MSAKCCSSVLAANRLFKYRHLTSIYFEIVAIASFGASAKIVLKLYYRMSCKPIPERIYVKQLKTLTQPTDAPYAIAILLPMIKDGGSI